MSASVLVCVCVYMFACVCKYTCVCVPASGEVGMCQLDSKQIIHVEIIPVERYFRVIVLSTSIQLWMKVQFNYVNHAISA